MNYLQQYLSQGIDPRMFTYQRRPMPTFEGGSAAPTPEAPTGGTAPGPAVTGTARGSTAGTGIEGAPLGDTAGVLMGDMSGIGGGAGAGGQQAGGNAMNMEQLQQILPMIMKMFGGG